MYVKKNDDNDSADGELRARFTAFMVQLVTNAKADYIRRQKHSKREILMDTLPESNDRAFAEERWQNGVSDKEFNFAEKRISDALSSLPALRRRILELSFIERLTAQEIAETLECSVKFVYDQKHAALKKLRDILVRGSERDG